MTRIRVLQRAIKLLETGWMPDERRGQAKDASGNIVSVMHPDACFFTPTGAVARAIYLFTGDTVLERLPLWESSMYVFVRKFGSPTAMANAFEKMTKEEAIATFQQQLDEWNNL